MGRVHRPPRDPWEEGARNVRTLLFSVALGLVAIGVLVALGVRL